MGSQSDSVTNSNNGLASNNSMAANSEEFVCLRRGFCAAHMNWVCFHLSSAELITVGFFFSSCNGGCNRSVAVFGLLGAAHEPRSC